MNFAANGVPNNVLADLMKDSLAEKVKPLLDWEPNSLPKLVCYLYDTMHIVSGRLRHVAGAQARLYGWSKDEIEAPDDVELDPDTGLLGMYYIFLCLSLDTDRYSPIR